MSDDIRPELIEEVAQRLAVSGGMVSPQEHHRKTARHALEVCGTAMGTLRAELEKVRGERDAATERERQLREALGHARDYMRSGPMPPPGPSLAHWINVFTLLDNALTPSAGTGGGEEGKR